MKRALSDMANLRHRRQRPPATLASRITMHAWRNGGNDPGSREHASRRFHFLRYARAQGALADQPLPAICLLAGRCRVNALTASPCLALRPPKDDTTRHHTDNALHARKQSRISGVCSFHPIPVARLTPDATSRPCLTDMSSRVPFR
jgi:hypothetical protein